MFCIFGRCSPCRKSAATVRTVLSILHCTVLKRLCQEYKFIKGKRGAVGRALDYSSEGRWIEPIQCFWRCRCRIRQIRSGVNSRQLWRTQRQAARLAAWPGTARRHSTAPSPPCLYFLAGVTRRAYFYGLYYFAFLECALPGVN